MTKVRLSEDGTLDIPIDKELNLITARQIVDDDLKGWQVQKVIIKLTKSLKEETIGENLVIVETIGEPETRNRFRVEQEILNGQEDYLVISKDGLQAPQLYQLLTFSLEHGYKIYGKETYYY